MAKKRKDQMLPGIDNFWLGIAGIVALIFIIPPYFLKDIVQEAQHPDLSK